MQHRNDDKYNENVDEFELYEIKQVNDKKLIKILCFYSIFVNCLSLNINL